MLRRSLLRRIDVRHTSVPTYFQHPAELGFYFPRFHPHTHIQTAGIPELQDAVTLMTAHTAKAAAPSGGQTTSSDAAVLPPPRWTTTASSTSQPTSDASCAAAQKDNAKSLLLLERGIDIFDTIGGVASPSVANMIRPLYAARFELLNGSEHLPRSDYGRHVHVQKSILKQSAKLLYFNDAWDKSDVRQLDTSCVLLAHFVKAFCALHQRPFHLTPQKAPAAAAAAATANSSAGAKHKVKSVGKTSSSNSGGKTDAAAKSAGLFDAAQWRVQVGDSPDEALTLAMVMDRVDELLRLSSAAFDKYGHTHPNLRWLRPKLLILKALVTIPLTGHLLHAQKHIMEAVSLVDGFTRRKSLLMEGFKGRVEEPELGLYMLLRAEMASRIADWDVPVGQVDDEVISLFEDALEYYPAPYITAIDKDGIMSETHLPERRFEAEAYACALRSFARFLQNAPRPKATSTRDVPVFLPKQVFSLNPLLTVATSSPYIFSDVQRTRELPLEQVRRSTGEALDKALKLNRMLYPEIRQNPAAASTLLAMACMYADTRDYLYATGLFESAKKAVVYAYGDTTMEHVLVQKLRYEFLAGVGSEQEAKTASHEVVHLLKSVDNLPF